MLAVHLVASGNDIGFRSVGQDSDLGSRKSGVATPRIVSGGQDRIVSYVDPMHIVSNVAKPNLPLAGALLVSHVARSSFDVPAFAGETSHIALRCVTDFVYTEEGA